MKKNIRKKRSDIGKKHNYTPEKLAEAAVKRSYTVFRKKVLANPKEYNSDARKMATDTVEGFRAYKIEYRNIKNEPIDSVHKYSVNGNIYYGISYRELGSPDLKYKKSSISDIILSDATVHVTDLEFKKIIGKKTTKPNFDDMSGNYINIGNGNYKMNVFGKVVTLNSSKSIQEQISGLKRNEAYAILISLGLATKKEIDAYYGY